MLIESHDSHSYRIIRVEQEGEEDTDFGQIEDLVAKYVAEGMTKIAISLSINAYPYSKLISVLVRCDQLVKERGGTLAVVQSNKDFIEVLKRTKLDAVFRIAASEEELAG